MTLRPTQANTFNLVQSGLSSNLARLLHAQEQVASGKRILRPSDDAAGTAEALSLRRRASEISTWRAALGRAQPVLASGAARVQEASELMSEARALVVQGMSGTLAQGDRDVIAVQLEHVYDQLLELSNTPQGDGYLFGGTGAGRPPFAVEGTGDGRRAVYQGSHASRTVLVGRDVRLDIDLPGERVFGGARYTGTSFSEVTGVRAGSDPSSGSGYARVLLRTDAVTGALGAGVALAAGGEHTLIGAHTLTVDAAAGTVQLGSGAPVAIPTPLPTALEVHDADGAQLVLDLSGWTGADFTGTLTGEGSIALNGGAYQALSLVETNLQLVDDARGQVVHVDTTQVTRAGEDVVAFQGATNVFDTLAGIAADLRNAGDLSPSQMRSRVEQRFGELVDGHERLLAAAGELGARHARLDQAELRLGDLAVQLEGLRSEVEDADLGKVVLDMTRAEQTLQVAQAAGARLLQQSLLNYLR
jgi:flagellar hook-associated protein 3 FlgL